MDNYEDGEGGSAEDSTNCGYSEGLKKSMKLHNVLPLWGNENSMNLNPLVLANIQASSYFKVALFKLKTYHEVVDEIYYQVKHMEPWEKGSRKTGQTGMCGGVRGVGAGGIVSSAYCLLYKLYTLRLTRKQLNGLLTHTDSPYIRALGFMYIRYTQPPGDLFDWYEQYLQDEEEIDVKAGGGQTMTIGQMLLQWLTKLDWFSTLFPRIPVPIQKTLEKKLKEFAEEYGVNLQTGRPQAVAAPGNASYSGQQQTQRRREETNYYEEETVQGRKYERERTDKYRGESSRYERQSRSRSRSRNRSDNSSYGKNNGGKERYGEYSRSDRDRSKHYERDRDRERDNRDRDREKDRYNDRYGRKYR